MKSKFFAGIAVAALCISLAGCKKKPVAANTPPPPAPTAAAPSTPSTPTPTRQSEPSRPTQVASTPASRMPDQQTRNRIQELLDRIEDAYFDYDKHSIRPDAEKALKDDVATLAEIIKQYPDFRLTVEGYCDERGSDEYNLALGEARAKQAKDYMASLGLPSEQLKTVSYGKERPICTEHDEACWQKNRRAHITQAQ